MPAEFQHLAQAFGCVEVVLDDEHPARAGCAPRAGRGFPARGKLQQWQSDGEFAALAKPLALDPY